MNFLADDRRLSSADFAVLFDADRGNFTEPPSAETLSLAPSDRCRVFLAVPDPPVDRILIFEENGVLIAAQPLPREKPRESKERRQFLLLAPLADVGLVIALALSPIALVAYGVMAIFT